MAQMKAPKRTKKAQLIDLLSKGEPINLDALSSALSWQRHTTSAAMTRLKQEGYSVLSAAMNLAHISKMDRPILEQAWQKHLPKVPIPNLNLRTLRSALAYELQIKEMGDVSKKTARKLRGFLPDVSQAGKKTGGAEAQTTASTKTPSTAKPPLLTKGTVLVREWNGRRYQVQVLDDGFEMDGRVYASLSKIAKSITGTDWSGPRFFGLSKASSPLPDEKPGETEACASGLAV